MQIIADIPHNNYKITVFKNGFKYSIQLEGKFIQLTFRLPEMHAFDSNAKVMEAIDKGILTHAIEAIHREEANMMVMLKNYEEDEYFEPII